MNFRDLEYLLAVAKYQHFGKAAEATFVSQPALSMQLKKLEEELGVALFERTNKQVFTTPIGNEIVLRARDILKEKAALIEHAKSSNNPLGGRFKFGAFPTLAPYLFPIIIPRLHKQLPDLQFELIEEKTGVLLEKLLAGELDAALLALPIEEDHLQTQHLFDDPFYLAVPTQHPLAQHRKITQRQLADQFVLLLEEGHCLRGQAIALCQKHQMMENAEYRGTSLEMLRQMVIANQGITLIPEVAIVKSRYIQYIAFAAPVPNRQIALVSRKSSARSACFEAIAQTVRAMMKKG